MFSHIMLGANDIQESKGFYDAALGPLGYEPGVIDEKGRCFYFTEKGILLSVNPLMTNLQLMAMAPPSALPL